MFDPKRTTAGIGVLLLCVAAVSYWTQHGPRHNMNVKSAVANVNSQDPNELSPSARCSRELMEKWFDVKDAIPSTVWTRSMTSENAVLSFVKDDGSIQTVPLNQDEVNRMTNGDTRGWISSFSKTHKAMKKNKESAEMMYLYENNLVVSADVNSCRITGIYYGRNGKVHPAVDSDIQTSEEFHLHCSCKGQPCGPKGGNKKCCDTPHNPAKLWCRQFGPDPRERNRCVTCRKIYEHCNADCRWGKVCCNGLYCRSQKAIDGSGKVVSHCNAPPPGHSVDPPSC